MEHPETWYGGRHLSISMGDMETGRSIVQYYVQSPSEFEASLSNVSHYLQKKKIKDALWILGPYGLRRQTADM